MSCRQHRDGCNGFTKRVTKWLCFIGVLALSSCFAISLVNQSLEVEKAVADRPVSWGQSIAKPGLPNFHKINDHLYRGAQPSDEGFVQLKAMGIRTVVNLRSFHSDRDACGLNDLEYVHLYDKAWHPEDEDVAKFLVVVIDQPRQPVFVHCQHGHDGCCLPDRCGKLA
jgi:protein tyrosine phosphatase (PTP) superfamily phosphohydrolase (DUF442 family)